VLVEADGLGGAYVVEVDDGNPCDRICHRSEYLDNEDDACRLARKWTGLEDDDED